ncbi:hypothetical protein MTR67_049723 [Solanum verrucosum]|uniref:NB-ARC domain-containing protein n=1 Tax=Solanum verrucosum TaxID=315347 RepID=A0AAF0V3Z3_SOLVR|nr:hypothetical protein MTR67_049723 [Solanum verrucosum]
MYLRAFSIQQLHEATNCIKNKLGQGASGGVYSGILKLEDEEVEVAVKKLGNGIEQAEPERRKRSVALIEEFEQKLYVSVTLNDEAEATFGFWRIKLEMDIGLAVGGAFLSSALNVLFDRLSPQGELLKMFQKHTHHLRDAVDSAENLIEEVNCEALRLKVEGQHQNLAETSNQQVSHLSLSLSDEFFLNIKDKLEENIETLEELQKQSETEELVGRLLSVDGNGRSLTVIPVVGMGGVGKTTLAKAVYNDEKVNDHFDLKAWFCVSEQYDAFRIAKGLLQEIGLQVDDNINQIQIKLKESLKGECALMMGGGAMNVGILSNEVSWALFKRHSLENRDPEEHLELEEIGKKIAEKCKGLPLAIKTLAGMLRSKSTIEKWKRILRSEIWELPDNGMLPALMLSYNDLPPHLKRCFSYCTIFPKDYQFYKEQVIQLWIANGLVQQLQKDEAVEELGNQYILEQDLDKYSQMDGEKFVMHDLVNDLAQIASQNFVPGDGDFGKLKTLYKLEQLRTLLPINIQLHLFSMGNLINLHYLDIRCCSRLKMLLHPSKLKSLQVLLGVTCLPSGLKLKDLGELCNLYGSLSIVELQNVVDRREALKENMREKEHIESTRTPSLKVLTIGYMDGITEVTEEFYGSPSSIKPFNSLEWLEFNRMSRWKQWHVLGSGEFPALQNLLIKECPELMGKLPGNLCSLTGLTISNCAKFILETPIQLSSLKSLSKTLKKIEIHDCEKLKLEPSASEMFLERLVLTECNSINDISPELVPRAHYLSVNSCHSLTRLLISTGTEDLDISGCENLEILLVASRTPTLLRTMKIHSCKKLKSLPEHMQELLPSLNHLLLYYCPEIKSFPEGGLPFSLEVLEIWYCKKLENDRKEWHLQRLPCLRELKIFHGSTDEEIHWELPCSIQRLEVYNMKTLSSQLLKSLTSLQSLSTLRLPQIQSMIEEGLPSSLSSLTLSDHRELHSLSTEGLRGLTSLRHLQISSCSQLQSLPESALPSSLSWLTIHSCPKLQHLPVKGMPSALSKLSISHCPLLNPRLEFMKGEYWPNIAHISTIQINGEYL